MTKTITKDRTAEPALFDAPQAEPAKPAKGKKAATTAVATRDPATPPPPAKARAAEPTSLLAVIMNAVSDPRCDTGKMRELLAMQREIDQEEARRAFVIDFMALTSDLPTVSADRSIEIRAKDASGERNGKLLQSTPYATFNAMMRMLKKPLKDHGFSLSYSTEPGADQRLNVTVYLDHVRGHQRKTIFPLPAETSGSKNNVQGWGSAQSYGMRYGTRALLNIITSAPEDADTDGRFIAQTDAGPMKEIGGDHDRLSADDVRTIKEKMKLAKITPEQFCKKYSIKDVGDLPPRLYDEAVSAIEAWVKQHGAKR